jgi:hypothetical protein
MRELEAEKEERIKRSFEVSEDWKILKACTGYWFGRISSRLGYMATPVPIIFVQPVKQVMHLLHTGISRIYPVPLTVLDIRPETRYRNGTH